MDAITEARSLPLDNWHHEQFCQSLARRLCGGEAQAEARTAAYIDAHEAKPGFAARVANLDTSTAEAKLAAYLAVYPSLPDNARRLANQANVKARVKQLNHRAAVLADTDRAWCVAQLRKRVEDFNLADFLARDEKGHLRFDIDNVTREQFGQLAELTIEEDIVPGDLDGVDVKRRKIRLKPYDPIAGVRLIADLSGVAPASRHELSGPGGGKIPLGLEALVLASMAPAPTQSQLPAPQKVIGHAPGQAA